MARGTRPVLTLVAERALRELIQPPKDSNVLEASGVVAKGSCYYVVFDNIRRIARVHCSLEPGSRKHAWFGPTRNGDGYEDIAYSQQMRRFYLLIEAEKHPDGTYKALIDECDDSARYQRRRSFTRKSSIHPASTRRDVDHTVEQHPANDHAGGSEGRQGRLRPLCRSREGAGGDRGAAEEAVRLVIAR